MADTRAFNDYFANRGALPGVVLVADDEVLVLRGSTVYRAVGISEFAYAGVEGNATATTINTIDVWESIGGTLVVGTLTDGITFATNQFTYIGVSQATPTVITAKMSASKAGGGDEIYQVGVFVNGSQIGTGMSCGAGTTLVGFASTASTHALQNGDVIDMRVRNTSGTSNVTLLDAQLIIG
jgi:hypothetical protein